MTRSPIGVAVIGAGMVGRAHASAYRNAATVFGLDQPAPRLVAIADVHEPFAADAAARYGFERAETDWRAVVGSPEGDAVSVCVGIAAAGGGHIALLSQLAELLLDPEKAEQLRTATTTDQVYALLTPSEDDDD